MHTLLTDIRHALRSLYRTPTFALMAVVTLALGIGANTAMFSLANAVLLRPLPYPDADQLYVINESANGSTERHVSGHEYAAWRDQNRTLQGIMMYEGTGFNLTGDGEPAAVFALSVSANYFTVLGARAILGREFRDGEDRRGANRVVVLSTSLWQSRFASDRAVVGRSVRLNDEQYTVVGVMARRAFDPQLWVPADMDDVIQQVGKHSLNVVGRLKNDATELTMRADLARVSAGLEQLMPAVNTGHGANPVSMYDAVLGEARRPVFVALGAVGFVLLIACANVAHLLLTRATNRQREIALRTALGATRGRLARHLLTESLLLSVAGGFGGLLLAMWIIELAPHFAAANLPRMAEVSIDARVLMAVALCVVITAAISGVLPALRGTVPRLGELLNNGRGAPYGVARHFAGFMVVSEVALALVLLVGAGLTMKSLNNLEAVAPGFDSQNVLMVGVSLPGARYATPEQQRTAIDQILTNIQSVPGVLAVGTTTQFPLTGENDFISVNIEGAPSPTAGQKHYAAWRSVSTDFFGAMKIRVLSGRVFQNTDARVAVPVIRFYEQQPYPKRFNEPQAAPVAVINETMAKLYWPDTDPIGKRFTMIASPPITVIGVVADIKHSSLALPASAEVYLSNLQEPVSWATIAIRTSVDPLTIVSGVRGRVRAFDSELPVEKIRTLEQVRSQSIGDAQLNATLLGAFGVLAFVMAVVGLYGVISYSVAQRTQEIGIRRAIGASGRDVTLLILRRAAVLTGTGLVVGTAGALSLSRVLDRLLFEVKPADPATLIGMAVVLGAVAVAASYVPARRAMKVDPLEALRAR